MRESHQTAFLLEELQTQEEDEEVEEEEEEVSLGVSAGNREGGGCWSQEVPEYPSQEVVEVTEFDEDICVGSSLAGRGVQGQNHGSLEPRTVLPAHERTAKVTLRSRGRQSIRTIFRTSYKHHSEQTFTLSPHSTESGDSSQEQRDAGRKITHNQPGSGCSGSAGDPSMFLDVNLICWSSHVHEVNLRRVDLEL